MQRQGGQPDAITYNTVISSCGKAPAAPERALGLFETMQRQGVAPGTITYNAVISACEKGGKPARALELFAEMLRRGMEPTATTSGAVFRARAQLQAGTPRSLPARP